MAVGRLAFRGTAHDLVADALENAVLRCEGDRALRLDLKQRAAFVRHAVNDQIVQGIAFIAPLELYPFDPGVGEPARLAAGQHLEEIEGAQLALDIGSSAPTPDRAGAAILLLRFFRRQ